MSQLARSVHHVSLDSHVAEALQRPPPPQYLYTIGRSFRSRREQPKTRRPKQTAKPRLEELAKRILPSASTGTEPQMAEVRAQMAAAMEQTFQLAETVEQNLVNIFDTYTQMVAQDVASAVQQWKNLAGIAPAPSGSGSGSGSGTIAPTNNVTHQPPVPIKPQSGSGMGSGATTSHENPSKSQLTTLTGSGSGSGLPTITEYNSSGSIVSEESGSCGSVNAVIGVKLSHASNLTVSVNYKTQDESALSGTDYTAESGTVTFQPGQTVQSFNIPILDDGNDEGGGNQSFQVQFSNPVNATLANNYVVVTIVEGKQQAATDTLRWNPCPDSSDLASDPTNWYDVTQGFQLQNGAPGPGSSTPVQFDDYASDAPHSDAPITWDQSFTVASISVQGGYNAVQTMDGEILEMDGINGVTLTVDPTSTADFDLEGDLQTDTGTAEIDGKMYVNFLAAGKVDNINGGTRNVRDDIDYGENGKVNIYNGGTLNLGVPGGKNQQSGSPINVTNGTLNFGDKTNSKNYSTFQLTTASADINIGPNGTMNVYQTGGTPINNVLGGQGAVINNNGTVNLQGVTGAGGTNISVPLQNHATLNAYAGDWTFDQKDVSGNDLSMDAGNINLANGAKIYCFHGYTQTAGLFQIVSSQATLAVTGVPANFNGGTVSFSTSNGVLNTGGIAFNGTTLNMSITGSSTTSNVINSTSCSIKGTSTINVSLQGATIEGPWALIKNPAGTNIQGDFGTVNLPPGVFETEPVTNTWSCYVT